MFQACDGRNVCQVAQCHNQHPEFRQFIQEIQLLYRVMSDIKRVQVFAPDHHCDFIVGMLPGTFSPQCGKSGVVCPYSVSAVSELNAKLYIREKLIQFVIHLQVHNHIVHVYLFQVRQLQQEIIERIPLEHLSVSKVHILCILVYSDIPVSNFFCLLSQSLGNQHQEHKKKQRYSF